MKKGILIGIIIGIVLTGTSVYAAYKYQASEVGYTPSNSNFKVDSVEQAINELYDSMSGPTYIDTSGSGSTYKGIIYLDPTNLKKKCTLVDVNANYKENGTKDVNNNIIPTGIKTGCMKWYIFNDSGNNYTMILDHNTTAAQRWSSQDGWSSTDSGPTTPYSSSLAKVEVDKLVSEFGWIVQPRLITVDEVNTITGKTNFDSNNYTYNYCLDDPQTYMYAKQCPSFTGAHSWLYDYTRDCVSRACNVADDSTYGYFTSNVFSYQGSGGYYHKIWSIWYFGQLIYEEPHTERTGIRPVITISKSVIK